MDATPQGHPLEHPDSDEITGRELAWTLRVDPKTISRWRAAGRITPVRFIGLRPIYSRRAVIALFPLEERGVARDQDAGAASAQDHQGAGFSEIQDR